MSDESEEPERSRGVVRAPWAARLLGFAFALATFIGAATLSAGGAIAKPLGALPLLLMLLSFLVRLVEEEGGPIKRVLGRNARFREWVIERRMKQRHDSALSRPDDLPEPIKQLPTEDGRACVLAKVIGLEGEVDGDVVGEDGQAATFTVLVGGKALLVEASHLHVHGFDDLRVGETIELWSEVDVPSDAPDIGAFRSGAREARTRGEAAVYIAGRHEDRLPDGHPSERSSLVEDMAPLPAIDVAKPTHALAESLRISKVSYPWLAHGMCLVVGIPAVVQIPGEWAGIGFVLSALASLILLLPGVAARQGVGIKTAPSKRTARIAAGTGRRTVEGQVRLLGSVDSKRGFFWRRYAIEDASGVVLVNQATSLPAGVVQLKDGDRVRATLKLTKTRRRLPAAMKSHKLVRGCGGLVQIDQVLNTAPRVRVENTSKRKERERQQASRLRAEGYSRDEARREARQESRRNKHKGKKRKSKRRR